MDAIEIARLTGRRLMVAAKVPTSATEVKYWRTVVKPALVDADVTILGELPETERDRLVASSRAAIIPSAWPEPFGLVVIEALALGTPVLVRRVRGDPRSSCVTGSMASSATTPSSSPTSMPGSTAWIARRSGGRRANGSR